MTADALLTPDDWVAFATIGVVLVAVLAFDAWVRRRL